VDVETFATISGQVVMMMLRNRELRRYQNHLYDAPSYLHLVGMKTVSRPMYEQFRNHMQHVPPPP
jgi:hypothetical protein